MQENETLRGVLANTQRSAEAMTAMLTAIRNSGGTALPDGAASASKLLAVLDRDQATVRDVLLSSHKRCGAVGVALTPTRIAVMRLVHVVHGRALLRPGTRSGGLDGGALHWLDIICVGGMQKRQVRRHGSRRL